MNSQLESPEYIAAPHFSRQSEKSIEDKVYIAESPIHGMGCFAKKRIRRNAYIGSYEGMPVLEDGTHVLWVEQDHGGWHLVDGKNALRYLNHSPEPNAEFDGARLYALRNIEVGEEITFHYGDEWED